MSDIDLLKVKETRASRRFEISKVVLLTYFGLATLFLGVQVIVINTNIQNSLNESKKSAAENHSKTQAYIRCLFEVVNVPLADRSSINFDDCTARVNGSTADDRASAGGAVQNSQQGQIDQSSTPAVQNPDQTVDSPRDIPGTSMPPEPEASPSLVNGVQDLLINLTNPLKQIGL
jgi:hypothetical protein